MSSPQDLEDYLAKFLTIQADIVSPLSSLSVMFFIYGIYVMVFGLSIHVLLRKKNSAPSRLYIRCTVVLFALASLFIVATVIIHVYQTTLAFDTIKSRDYTKLLMYVTFHRPAAVAFAIVTSNISNVIMNIVADWMLIHRCYVVWDFSPWVLYPFSLVACILNGMNLGTYIVQLYNFVTGKARGASQTAFEINNWNGIVIAGFTLLLAFTTGGRIWWISCRARRLIGMPSHPKYNAIVQIIIESGLLYATTLVGSNVMIMTLDPRGTGAVAFDASTVITLMSGLAPTLIIVRVAYGSSINSVQQMISTLRFAEIGNQAQPSTTSINAFPNIEPEVNPDTWDGSLSDLEEGRPAITKSTLHFDGSGGQSQNFTTPINALQNMEIQIDGDVRDLAINLEAGKAPKLN